MSQPPPLLREGAAPAKLAPGSRFRRRVAGVLRVAALVVAVAPLLGMGVVKAAQGELGSRSLAMGRELSALVRDLDRFSVLTINGNTVIAGGNHVDASLETVLDGFEKHCTDFGWDATTEVTAMTSRMRGAVRAAAGVEVEKPWSVTLARKRSSSEGLVVCLAPSEKHDGLDKFLARAKVAMDTGQLSAVGQIRYLYARKHAEGGSDVVVVLTTGDFNMNRFSTKEGDAPGRDLEQVPRPTNSRRVLQIELADSPYVVRSYATYAAPADVLASYRRSLPARDWQVITPLAAVTQNSLTFEKDGAAVLIQAATQDGATRVDIVQMGSRGAASVTVSGSAK